MSNKQNIIIRLSGDVFLESVNQEYFFYVKYKGYACYFDNWHKSIWYSKNYDFRLGYLKKRWRKGWRDLRFPGISFDPDLKLVPGKMIEIVEKYCKNYSRSY